MNQSIEKMITDTTSGESSECPGAGQRAADRVLTNLADVLTAQATPLFAQGAAWVTAATCCKRTYVGPPPEHLECSLCHAPLHTVEWMAGTPASEIVAQF